MCKTVRNSIYQCGRAAAQARWPGFLIAITLTCVSTASAQQNSGVSAYATVANDYYVYGLSQLSSGTSVRLSADYQHVSGFFAGSSLANIETDRDRARGISRDLQVDLYAGYAVERPRWTASVSLSRYLFPDDGVDYDFSRVDLGVVYHDRLYGSVQLIDDLLGTYGAAVDYEIGGRLPLPRDSELSLSLGRYASRRYRQGDFTHWNIGVSKLIRKFGLDLRYYENTAAGAHAAGNAEGDEWVLAVSVSLKERR
jgi:uncharacterized protein (TIGR02001 family)